MNRTLIVSVLLLASTAVFSQTPYAGMKARPIKALSEQQVAKRSTPNRPHNPERPRALQESMGRTERA